MIVHVGSTNKNKLEAVAEVLKDYPLFSGVEIIGVSVETGVADQPLTMEETICGAINRAKNAYQQHYSIGLEGGLVPVPHTKSGYMNFGVCAIYDGKNHHLGVASGHENPVAVTKYIIEEGLDMSEAYYRAGLFEHKNIGAEHGAIHLLTKGRWKRKEQERQALMNALIHLENDMTAK